MKRNVATMIACIGMAAGLVACSDDPALDPNTPIGAATKATETKTFEPKEASPVTVTNLKEPQTDPGLNIEVTLQATGANTEGAGSVVYLLVKNLNDVPLPPDVLTVSLKGASPVTAGTVGLDLPLGAGATTNLQFAFDASYGELYDAKFTIGNLIFQGNLAGV